MSSPAPVPEAAGSSAFDSPASGVAPADQSEPHPDNAGDVEQPPQPDASDAEDSEDSDYPPPVSVSHVRVRVNPTLVERDELR